MLSCAEGNSNSNTNGGTWCGVRLRVSVVPLFAHESPQHHLQSCLSHFATLEGIGGHQLQSQTRRRAPRGHHSDTSQHLLQYLPAPQTTPRRWPLSTVHFRDCVGAGYTLSVAPRANDLDGVAHWS